MYVNWSLDYLFWLKIELTFNCDITLKGSLYIPNNTNISIENKSKFCV